MKKGPRILDSGKRQSFGTGAVRDIQTDKGRYDLLPPEAIAALAKHFEAGAVKYCARNWEKGIPLSRYLDSALRHTFKILAGMDDEPHAEAAMWNMATFIATRQRIKDGDLPKELNDLKGLRKAKI